MTDDPIIEIIARAIASSDGINPDERLLFGPDDDGAYEAYWKHYEDNARAVIAIAKPLIAAVARDNTKLALWFVCPPLAAVVTAGDWLKLWTGAR